MTRSPHFSQRLAALHSRRADRAARLSDAEIEAEVNRRVAARMETLEQKLLREMAVAGERRLRDAAAVVGHQMERRVGMLERHAEAQLRALAEASQSSDVRTQMIDTAANAIQARLRDIEPLMPS